MTDKITYNQQLELDKAARHWSEKENEKERTYQKEALIGERKYNADECEKQRKWQAEENAKDRALRQEIANYE